MGSSGIGIPELLILLMFALPAIGGTILWIWMIVDCATKEPSAGNDKLIWILIIGNPSRVFGQAHSKEGAGCLVKWASSAQ